MPPPEPVWVAPASGCQAATGKNLLPETLARQNRAGKIPALQPGKPEDILPDGRVDS